MEKVGITLHAFMRVQELFEVLRDKAVITAEEFTTLIDFVERT